jgi:hypothetical protein
MYFYKATFKSNPEGSIPRWIEMAGPPNGEQKRFAN